LVSKAKKINFCSIKLSKTNEEIKGHDGMLKEIGAVLIFVGMMFLLTCWNCKSMTLLLGELILGPIFISLGWQLLQ
jgi:hypothetical protein